MRQPSAHSEHRARELVGAVRLETHTHRKPSLWDNPDRFDPERFAPERAAARPRFAYIPFGGGPRICIGAAFAMSEAMLILTTIAQRYRKDPTLRGLCQGVVPVAGLLAQTGRTLRQAEFDALAQLSQAPRDEVDRLLLSTDRFLQSGPLASPAIQPGHGSEASSLLAR